MFNFDAWYQSIIPEGIVFRGRFIEFQFSDSRVKPYFFNKRWILFAEASGDISLMMDFDPNVDGTYGQISVSLIIV